LRGYIPCPFREVIAFRDKLIELHKIRINYESLRQILIKEGLHGPKRKRRIHRRRWRDAPRLVWLFQMAPSLHAKTKDMKFQTWNYRRHY
jgi:hypothetical protein